MAVAAAVQLAVVGERVGGRDGSSGSLPSLEGPQNGEQERKEEEDNNTRDKKEKRGLQKGWERKTNQ